MTTKPGRHRFPQDPNNKERVLELHLGIIGLGVALFVSTNIDDVFVLLGFFANRRFRFRHIVLGQLIGIGALYGASALASLLSLVMAQAWIGLLGLVPIAIGLKQLWDLRAGADESNDEQVPSAAGGTVFAVAAVTMANGGDNLGVYVPLFATLEARDIALIGLVFAVMTLAWLGLAQWLTRHRTLGAPIRRYGARAAPFVLIAVGIWILHEAGTLSLLRR
jgi:cadmium resistance protein CadD (predicted permease)